MTTKTQGSLKSASSPKNTQSSYKAIKKRLKKASKGTNSISCLVDIPLDPIKESHLVDSLERTFLEVGTKKLI